MMCLWGQGGGLEMCFDGSEMLEVMNCELELWGLWHILLSMAYPEMCYQCLL